MTITVKKNSVDVRVELRRNDSDFIGDDRAYYTYFFSKAGCFGSAKVTEKEVYPIDCESFTTKERENFKDALASLQPDILKLASFLNKENENKGDLESALDLQWALAKRGRPSLDDKPLIRSILQDAYSVHCVVYVKITTALHTFLSVTHTASYTPSPFLLVLSTRLPSHWQI